MINNLEILKANNLGIVNGVSNDQFAPNKNITRQEIAVMFHRLLNALDIDPVITLEYIYFNDENDIAPWARDSIQILNKLGILGGVGNNSINPTGNTTREQAIALIIRIFETYRIVPDEEITVIESWKLQDPLWIIFTNGISRLTFQSKIEGKLAKHVGVWGGQLDYLYEGMKTNSHLEELQKKNSIIIYNPYSENWNDLKAWPTNYKFLLPIDIQEIQREANNLPFLYFNRCEYGMLRGIIVVADDTQLAKMIDYIIDNEID